MKSSDSYLLNISKYRCKSHAHPAFTIVELLVVIVVIGILASITIISFSGITQKAVISSLQSDLNNASKLLKMDQITNSSFPSTLVAANNGKGIPSSIGNSYTYYYVNNSSNPQIFALQATNSNGVSYRISENSKPIVVTDSRTSCYDILNAGESTGSGMYLIKPSGVAMPVYCDMSTSGGGWTLIVCSVSVTGWSLLNVSNYNSANPSISANYSILDQADAIKSNIGGNLYYRMDATSFGSWGGVWSAPYSYIFTKTDNTQTSVSQIEKYSSYTYPSDTGIEARMPWLGSASGFLTTSQLSNSNWWGTIVGTAYSPAPWINTENPNPGKIWYWVR